MVVSQNLNGYVTKDRMWAAVPFGKSKFIIIHNGQQVHVTNNLITAKSYINKQTIVPKNKTSSLEQFL
jgi:hypothetical protein